MKKNINKSAENAKKGLNDVFNFLLTAGLMITFNAVNEAAQDIFLNIGAAVDDIADAASSENN